MSFSSPPSEDSKESEFDQQKRYNTRGSMKTYRSMMVNDDQDLRKTKSVVREIGSQAVWSLSSCKHGFGVEQLRDNCQDTYWQSDGIQPHLVNIQFRRKTTDLSSSW
ncbi:hypothetical protein SSS_08363 [Sarcoptes scabiei]|nr:hypothetical protein SSS_08363 [Sarcoptes scabiei]